MLTFVTDLERRVFLDKKCFFVNLLTNELYLCVLIFFDMTTKQYYKLFGLEYGFTWDELCEAYQRVYEEARKKAETGGAVEKFALKQVDEAYAYLEKQVYVEEDGIYQRPPKHPRKNDAELLIFKK